MNMISMIVNALDQERNNVSGFERMVCKLRTAYFQFESVRLP